MGNGETFEVEEIDSPIQRVIRRNRAFFALPIAATAVAFLLIVWEVVRQNLPADVQHHWPWELRLLDLQSAATIATVLAVFLFTRAQYAEAVRPVIGWTLHPANEREQPHVLSTSIDALTLAVFNGGGGLAVVDSVFYRFARNTDPLPSPWVPYENFHEYMSSAGLVNLKDYYFEYFRAGYPLVPTVHDENLPVTGVIKIEALLRFRIFDIRIRIRDAVGDLHERVLPCRAVLKDSILVRAIETQLVNGETSPKPNALRRAWALFRDHG